MNRESVQIIGSDIHFDSKKVYNFGRCALGLVVMTYGILLLTGHLSKSDDLKSYYNFWQHCAPQSYGGRNQREELESFQAQSLFEF